MHSVTNLSHRYGTQWIFKNISLNIEQGECIALLGESGCGKSTLLRNIAGLEKPVSGTITIDDQLVFSNTERYVPTSKRGIGLVFQDYALFPALTVEENIAFGINKNSKERVDSLLKIIGMLDKASLYPHQLSGGQQQRVALARALAPKPKLLLLDEPFANVDASRRMELREELRRILDQEGTSALFVTHDQHDALSLADRIAVMEIKNQLGQISQCARPETIYQQPINPGVASLTGKLNIINGTANSRTADSQIGRVPLCKEHSGSIQILIRPENISYRPGEGNAVVTFCACLGSHFQLSVLIAGQQLRLYHHQAIKNGSRGQISIKEPCWFWG